MSTALHRLGRAAYIRRREVATAWLLLLLLVGVAAAALSGETTDHFSIAGTEAQEALDLLQERFPDAATDGASARVVVATPDGRHLSEDGPSTAIDALLSELAGDPEIVSAAPPSETGAVSADGTVGLIEVEYGSPVEELSDGTQDRLLTAVQRARGSGLTVEVGGDAAGDPADQGLAEVIGLLVAVVVLCITLRSVIAAGLPLATALVGVGTGMAAIAVASGYLELNADTPALGLMIGLAVGIDYSLLVIVRYRQELRTTGDGHEAAGRAIATAGSAIVFACLTTVVALLALAVLGIPVLTEIGVGAAGTVLVTALVALTLMPALLGFAGDRAAQPTDPHQPSEDTSAAPSLAARWARLVTGRPVPFIIAATLALGVIALPALDLRLGWPHDGTAPTDTTQRKAYDLVAEGFGEGFNAPLMIVVDTGRARHGEEAAAAAVRLAEGSPGAVHVSPPTLDEDAATALFTVIAPAGPDSEATRQLIEDIRAQAPALQADTGARLLVTGLSALDLDIAERMRGAIGPYLAIVVGLAFLLMMLVFRSVLVPLKATLGFMLTLAATFGAVVAVFQWGWFGGPLGVDQPGPIISIIPVFLIGLTFALAVDYQLFIVTRIRERFVAGQSPRASIVRGFEQSAPVVTAAALIMVSVFLGFVVSQNPLLKLFGFALGLGIFIDAFVVRMTIVPAVLSLLDRSAWWLPRWLDARLPRVDIEGEQPARDRASHPSSR